MRCAFLASVLVLCLGGLSRAQGPVDFADPNLKADIERHLWLSNPTATDLLQLTDLNAEKSGITDLSGIEYAVNLQSLVIRWNRISDLSPISSLTNLRHLDAHGNGIISDLSPLSALVNLESLVLRINNISDLSPLAGLDCLEELFLQCNSVSDLSPLAGLSALECLELSQNRVSDISALSGLHNLRNVILRFNLVRDISPLAGLNDLEDLHLQGNFVNDLSPLAGLTGLRNLDLANNRIVDMSPLLELTNLNSLNLEGNLDLSDDAYARDLRTIYDQGINLRYSPSRARPGGLRASQGTCRDKVELAWDPVPQGPLYTSYYRLYRATSPNSDRVALGSWQTSLEFDDTDVEPGVEYVYLVKAATSSQGTNASDFSAAAVGWRSGQPQLTISSTAGGSVTTPGEGNFSLSTAGWIVVQAEPMDASLYAFARWTGSAVEDGKVTNPLQASTMVRIDGNCTLHACFETRMDTIWVDDDGSGDPEVGDPLENGTSDHPFDQIQEAIEVASEGTSVAVRSGHYRETINLLGKSLTLTGLDSQGAEMPVIDGNGTGPVVSFINGEDPNCTIIGFVITGGWSEDAGAIACDRSSPTIANCLIVGNRASAPDGAAVRCQHSGAVFLHCTIADNRGGPQGGGMAPIDSQVSVSNSIIWGNAPGQIAPGSDSSPAIVYSDMAGGWPDAGNIEAEPLFARRGYWADPADLSSVAVGTDADAVWVAGDYHLMSQTGRWEAQSQSWVQDSVTSPCIDAGDPAAPVGNEPAPNAGIINLGTYGGTRYASLSGIAE